MDFLGLFNLQVNFDYFIMLGQMPVHQLLWYLFTHGGWIIIVWIALQSFWMNFKGKRRAAFASTLTYTMMTVQISKVNEQTPLAMEHVFAQLSSAYSKLTWWKQNIDGQFNPSFSFEIVSQNGVINFFIRTPSKFRDLVEAAIYSQYTDAEIMEIADYTDAVPGEFPDPSWDLTGLEYVLTKDSAYPIRTYPQFEHTSAEVKFKDPLSGFFEAMNTLKAGEQLWFQMILTPTDDSWVKKAEEVVAKISGKAPPPKKSSVADKVVSAAMSWPNEIVLQATGVSFAPAAEVKKDEKEKKLTPGENKMLEAIQEKMAKISLITKIRIVYIARREIFSKARLAGIKGAMSQFGSMNLNSFKAFGAVTPVPGGVFNREREDRMKNELFKAYRGRSGSGATPFVLNTEELATVYHFPLKDVKAPMLKKTEAKRSEAPTDLPTDLLYASPKIGTRTVAEDEADEESGDTPSNLPIG